MRRVSAEIRPDPREIPAYGIPEVAHYIGMPVATLRSWVIGRPYPVDDGERFFQPVIEIADKKNRRLSFINLVEAHVLNAIRREHEIRLPKIRQAIAFLKNKLNSKHPLADQHFETDGLDLFIREYGRLISISEEGQYAMREVLHAFLKRVRFDAKGAPVKLYLFVRGAMDEPFAVVVDPTVSFGRPVLEGTGIPTEILAQRYKAGDSYEQLVEDYGRPKEEIEEAIRYELLKAA